MILYLNFYELNMLSFVSLFRYWVNDGTKLVFIVIYVMINAALFTERFIKYYNTPVRWKK